MSSSVQKARAKKPRSSPRGSSSIRWTPGIGVSVKRMSLESVGNGHCLRAVLNLFPDRADTTRNSYGGLSQHARPAHRPRRLHRPDRGPRSDRGRSRRGRSRHRVLRLRRLCVGPADDPRRRPRHLPVGARGLRRGGAPRRALERPDRPARPRLDARHQRPRHAADRRAREGRRRRALRLLLVLQRVRRGRRRRRRDRAAPGRPAHGLRRVEGPLRGGALEARRLRLHPDLPAQRDRLRRLAEAALRPRAEQPGRLGPHHRRGRRDG